MKKGINVTLIDAVNRLWLSGLYGMRVGVLMGIIVGGITGTIVPIIGNLIGAIIGGIAGVFVGLLAGILGPAIGERQGWRIAGAVSCLLVAGIVGWIYTIPLRNTELVIILVVLSVLAVVGYWIGNVVYNRIESSDGMYQRWYEIVNAPAIQDLSTGQCLVCLAAALLPVLITYAQLAQLLRAYLT